MDRHEARVVLEAQLGPFRTRSHADLVRMIGAIHVAQVRGPSGAEYQVDVEVVWDSLRERTDVRVMGAIDDGRLPSSTVPVTHDFIVTPNDRTDAG
jgi:hypothetical protein